MKKIVFIDIDGTLYDHKNRCVPESAKLALKKAKGNGHELFICTGRVKEMVESSYRQLPVSGFVFSCGAHIIKGDETIYQAVFPREEMNQLMKHFREHHVDFTLEGSDLCYFSETSLKSYMSYFCGNNPEMEHKFTSGQCMKLMSEVNEEGYHQVLKMAFQAKTMEDLQPVLDHLSDKLTYFTYSDSFSGEVEGEILIKGWDKADSIDRVLEYFDGKMEDTIAIGDSDNDVSMIKKAKIGIAMGNACDSLKEVADYITTPVSEDGLYRAFEAIGLI